MSNKGLLQFENREYQEKYQRQGFVTIRLLDENDLRDIDGIYTSMDHKLLKDDSLKYCSVENTTKLKALEVSKSLLKVLTPKLNQHFQNIESSLATFVVKPMREQSNQAIPWHQALSYVDETKFEAAMIWIGLEAEQKDNWQFELLPATHKFQDYIRTAPQYPMFVAKYLARMKYKKVAVQLKAGEALIFNNRIINCSPPNCTFKERRALQVFSKVKEANWLYFIKEEQYIRQYNASTDFFLDLWIDNHRDEKALVKKFSYTFPKMTRMEFFKYLWPF